MYSLFPFTSPWPIVAISSFRGKLGLSAAAQDSEVMEAGEVIDKTNKCRTEITDPAAMWGYLLPMNFKH